jgi:hypothetical protein
MTVDLKTSLLVNRQVPEFIRDEYPKFITFLEAYYEFLETQANTAITSNNLVTTAKTLRNIRDVDDSLERFEKNFYNTYASLVPLNVQANKALLFKHLLPLYRSKGSEVSFKLLFQLIFGEDIDVILPKNNVLRASASNWQIDNKLRINPDISSRYTGNGTNKTFYLAQKSGLDDVAVYINNVLKTPKVDYFINKEYRQLNFITAPANNTEITVAYDNFDINLLNNRKVTGITSHASAIVETASRRIISDTLNLGLPIELLVNAKSLRGSFLNGEIVTIPINDETNNISIDIRASTFSIVRQFNLINAGNNYSVGDSVFVFGGNASVNAFGTVERVITGEIDTISVVHGGAVFSNASPISVYGNSSFTTMTVVVDNIDTSGANAANSFKVSPDVISNLSLNVGGTVYVNSSNFGAVFAKSNISAANSIANAFNYVTLTVGPISNVKILSSTVPLTEKNSTFLDAAGAQYAANAPFRYSKSLKSIGRYKINDAGSNYQIGDEVIFGANPPGTYGQMAAAVVGKISVSGAIQRIDSANSRIRGVGAVTAACNEITGTGTFFTQDLKGGDLVDINNESRIVSSITSDTIATVSSVFTYSASNRKIGVYDRWPLGGYGYTQGNFPTISVSSNTGLGASIQIDSLIGDGETLTPTGFTANGQIISIKVINPGSGYEYNPTVSIVGGDGSATAIAEIERSYASAPGRWTTSDSILSSFERKLQGQDYYVDYSYVISSKTEFSKYKTMLKQLLHPVGMVNYALYNKENLVELTDVAVQSFTANTISGTVNVGNGRVVVTGNSTKYNVANTRGILSLGSLIAVNGEIRKINTIVSNTSLITTSNISNLRIANAGSGYSNGYLVFSNGGGQITSLTITAGGSGYENGVMTFSGTDEAIPAVANVEVFNSNGTIRTLTFVSGGLYANKPIAIPDSNPHRVVYANGISISIRGQGYSNGWLIFSGGSPLRDANVRLIVHPNTVVNTVEVIDSGLYQSTPSARPNTNANVVISSVNVTSTGNGHSNGVLVISGGNPARAATIRVETFPQYSAQVNSIAVNAFAYGVNSFIQFIGGGDDNIAANARIYVTTDGLVQNVTLLNKGLYKGTPIARANIGNASFTLEMKPLDGQIRKITIVDPGLYANGTLPTAVMNNSPNSVSSITSNTVANTFVGRSLANGYLIFSGGLAVRDANATYRVYPSNGVINMQSIVVTDVGLYRIPPTTVTPNVTPVSVTQVLPIVGGSGYVNGNVVFSTTQATANIVANCTVQVNGAFGAIVRTTVNHVGLYANGADIIVVGILNPATAALQTPTTVASFSIGHNANTRNVANLVVTTTANVGQPASVTLTANSNSYTNAVFTITPVANGQTNAVITVGFTGRNTAANALVEVYPGNGAIRKVTLNSNSVLQGVGEYYYTPDVAPNSAGSGAVITLNPVSWYQTSNAQTAVIIKQ